MSKLNESRKVMQKLTPQCKRKRAPKGEFDRLKSESVPVGLGVYTNPEVRTVMFNDTKLSLLVSYKTYLNWIELHIVDFMPRMLRIINTGNMKGYISMIQNMDENIHDIIYNELIDILELGWELYDHS